MAEAKKVLAEIKRKIQQGGKPSQVSQLDLAEVQIGKITPEIKKLLQSCKNLKGLSMAECDLTSLENFPTLDKLEELDVSSNSLKDSDVKIIVNCCKNLTGLSIGDNAISSLDSIKALKGLKSLQNLNSDDTGVSNEKNYTKVAFESIPGLKYLDNKDKDGKEMEYDQEGPMQNNEDEEEDREDEDDEEDAEGEDDEEDYEEEEEEESEQAEEQAEEKPKKKRK